MHPEGLFEHGYYNPYLYTDIHLRPNSLISVFKKLIKNGYSPAYSQVFMSIASYHYSEDGVTNSLELYQLTKKSYQKSIHSMMNKKYRGVRTEELLLKPTKEKYLRKYLANTDRGKDFRELVARGFVDFTYMFTKDSKKGFAVTMPGFNLIYPRVFSTQKQAEQFNQEWGIVNITGVEKLPLNWYKISMR